MTTTPTAPTPEELAGRVGWPHESGMRLCGEKDIAAAIRQHSEALEAENERLRIMADEPTTMRVWDGIQAMAALFADPDHMPTVLEFKAAFDAAFVVDGKPYDVERIKAEWQADYAALEARATQAEAALAASQERERVMREALEATRRSTTNTYAGCADSGGDSWSCTVCGEEWETFRDDPEPHHPECSARKVIAALQPKEPHHDR